MEDIEPEEGIVRTREEIVIPKENENIRKIKEAKKVESLVKKAEPVAPVKKVVAKKAKIESSESESESESEEEGKIIPVSVRVILFL